MDGMIARAFFPFQGTKVRPARCAPMQKLWFITNPGSGSSTAAKCAAIEAAFKQRGLSFAGRTDFPEESLPTPADLDAAGIDTVVLFAGDGTINAAVCALASWDGAILILPGGTMNMLAKALHGSTDPAAIIANAHERGERVALPYVEAGKHRALVGLIVGPAANWVHAREMVRAGRFRGLGRAVAHAWRRTFGRGLRFRGAPALRDAQAVFVRPDDDQLAIAAIDAREFRSIATLGWEWIAGDWLAAAAVTERRAPTLTLAERKPVLALFDGEPQQIDPDAVISVGRTERQFIRTIAP